MAFALMSSSMTQLDFIAQDPVAAKNFSWTGLQGSALAYALSRLFLKLKKNFVVLLADAKQAAKLQEDLAYYLGSAQDLLSFPGPGILPYYGLSPNPDTVAERMAFLYELLHSRRPRLAVIPLSSALRRLPPKKIFSDYSEYLVAGEEIDRELLLKKLLQSGYLHVPVVEDPGTFSKRGGILDIFPPQLSKPVRIEFFGDKVETLRSFDPETQRSTAADAREDLVIIPAREIVFGDENLAKASRRFREKANDFGLPKPEREAFLEAIRQKMAPPALETYLPLFYEATESLFTYLPREQFSLWIEPQEIEKHYHGLRHDAEQAYAACQSAERIMRPEEVFLAWKDFEAAREEIKPSLYSELANDSSFLDFKSDAHQSLSSQLKHAKLGEGMLDPLWQQLKNWMSEGICVLLIAGTHTQFLRLKDLLKRSTLPFQEVVESFPDFLSHHKLSKSHIFLSEGHLSQGFVWPQEKLAILTDEEIFGEKQRRRVTKAKKVEAFTSFEEISEGDYVVHELHGLGIYRGLETLKLDGVPNDFLVLEYLGGDKLYLPVYRLNLVSRYAAQDGQVPQLDKMGGTSWEKSKSKVKKALRAMAGELLQLYAERATRRGHAFSPGGMLYEEFEATFPFEETPDQLRAIEEVNRDMDDERPMDRLVCGDVGFGKTEIAMRAAFRAVVDNKQVAVLVPTTVLALQHERNFRNRFQNFPARIEMLSRFVSPKRQKELLEELKHGKIDIIVGTHGLLGREVHFKDLGLLIIDEEHRFGVAQKEKIKRIKTLADVLTLTATPIPRTLNMSLSGIRDLSVITTPPVDRMAIQTFVANYNEALIREAVIRELSRGGQVYFVHNRVQTIEGVKRRLSELIPEAKIEVGHGQMEEGKLEEVMLRFVNREFNVFLCTSIVESGLDIPHANTMIINRADTFGLAQLYQLRGRIGRSNQRAFAYLLIPGQEAITTKARSRLAVLQRYTELGSGFKIAAHDLEIRGSGNLLGAEQSGHIAAVGYELYMKLMEEAILDVKGETQEQAPDPELHLKLAAAIPEDYIPETTMRLTLYKRFSAIQDEEELDALSEEVKDRFGHLPEEVLNLALLMRVKTLARRAWIKTVRLEARRVLFSFHQNSPVKVAYLTKLISKEPERFRWVAPHELAMGIKEGKESKSVESLLSFLSNLELEK